MNMVQERAAAPFFDASGRRNLSSRVTSVVNPATDRYGLAQPRIDHSVIYGRITEHFPATRAVSVTEFSDRAQGLLAALRQDDATREVVKGVGVPFVLAQNAPADLGKALEDTYLPAVGASWKARFPKFDFKNELKGGLAGKVAIAPGSRYERLMEAMAAGPVVGYYFPLALSGFSYGAALEQTADLPDSFVVSGGFEACAALTGCPELILKHDGYAPQLDLASMQAPAAGYGYHFAPYGYNLTFNGRFHTGLASDYCASGLTVIAASRKK